MNAVFAPPVPDNEMERVVSLADFDLDYSDLQDKFKDLTKLAAYVAGTEISLVNLIDSFTLWTVGNYNFSNDQTPREDTVCQYTLMENDLLEIRNLAADDRFMNRDFVTGFPHLRYYLGLPLKTNEGHAIGSLCLLDKKVYETSPEKVELLKGIADEIVNRLVTIKVINGLRNKVSREMETKKKVAHDIRGPLGGIIGLAQIVSEQGDQNKLEEVLEFINLIHKSSNSLLDLAEEILEVDQPEMSSRQRIQANELTLATFKTKLEQLYAPQAKNKNINFVVNTNVKAEKTPFSKNKLLQIVGNLISNALKFTPRSGQVTVDMDLVKGVQENTHTLHLSVKDTGVGLQQAAIDAILQGSSGTTKGTNDEKGYGFGLALVKHLIDSLGGTLHIRSKAGEGAVFEVALPQKY